MAKPGRKAHLLSCYDKSKCPVCGRQTPPDVKNNDRCQTPDCTARLILDYGIPHWLWE